MKCFALTALAAVLAHGQCAMCFRNAEAQSTARARALNTGIVILLVPLAAAAGAIAALAYRRRASRIVTGGSRDCPAAGSI